MFLMYSFLAFYVYSLCVLCVCFMGIVPESNKWLIGWLINIKDILILNIKDILIARTPCAICSVELQREI